MPLWWCGLRVVLDDLLKEYRVSIPSCFALCHCFAPDSRTDEQLRVLGKHGQDTRFIRFNEPISITDNFHASIIHLYTKLYHQTILTVCSSVASRNPLLYQSLHITIPYHYVRLRRRKDDASVGTTASGTVA